MSSGGKLKSVDQIAKNLLKVIIRMSNEITDIYNPDNLVIPEQVFQNQKNIFVAQAKSKKEKPALPPLANKRRYSKFNPKKSSKKFSKKSLSESNKLTTPIISCPDNLIGKLVYNLTDQDIESWEQKWEKVTVSEKSGGVHYNPKFVLKPIDSEGVYLSNNYEDYSNEEVKVYEFSSYDQIAAAIDHIYTDRFSDVDTWWRDVVDIDKESEDGNNSDFLSTMKTAMMINEIGTQYPLKRITSKTGLYLQILNNG